MIEIERGRGIGSDNSDTIEDSGDAIES